MPVLIADPESSPSSASLHDVIEIGLLNNLGDAGLETGERQIVDLLTAVAGSRTIRLHLFSLPSIARGPLARAYLKARYGSFESLMASRFDGLFVTGCEPRTARLRDEAYWPELAEVIDWAKTGTRSAIFSCLAAHAAVLHLDAIERVALPRKCSGLYGVERVAPHPLLAGSGDDLHVCHSRWNALIEQDLVACGYQTLTRSPVAGLDVFVKSFGSLFVFFQGHPEYDANALGREYRRDVQRFVNGLSETYPSLPAGYFGASTEAALLDFAGQARLQRNRHLMSSFPLKGSNRKTNWSQDLALTLFRNWIGEIEAKVTDRAA